GGAPLVAVGNVVLGLLGPLVVLRRGRVLDIGGAQPRLVLAMLLAAGNRVVSPDALIDGVWGESPPASAATTVQSYVSRLRKAFEPERAKGAPATVLRWDSWGYRVDVAPDTVDFSRFEMLADEGRAQLDRGELAHARETLLEADKLWRGPALAEFVDHEFARGL